MLTVKIQDRYKGNTSDPISFQIVDDQGSPVDITGYSIKTHFRYGSKKGEVKLDLQVGSGLSIVSEVDGAFNIDRIENLSIDSGVYYWDVKTTAPNGDIKTYVGGTMKVLETVTN